MKEKIKSFLDGQGRLKNFPAKRKMKIYCLFYLIAHFEADREYTEREVNELLLLWHTFGDPATLRRELIDYGFLKRRPDGRSYRVNPEQPVLDELVL